MGETAPPMEPSLKRRLRLFMYFGILVQMSTDKQDRAPIEIERVQTGVRLEKRMLKVLKAIAEQKDMTLGDLLEGIVLHAFEGKASFSQQTLKEIEQFKTLYGMTLKSADSHNLKERKR
jgi:ribbon-helix-helix protein